MIFPSLLKQILVALLLSAAIVSASTSTPSVTGAATIGNPPSNRLTAAKKSIRTATAPVDRTRKQSASLLAMESKPPSSSFKIPAPLKLVIGAGGIYGAFLYYGTLQEDVFRYEAADGSMFKAAWFLQFLEAMANVVIGGIGMVLSGMTPKLPQDMFAISGATQVCAKAFTSLALASGVSFPVVTLAKSGKMVPVMIGSLLLGGASYTLREYLAVAAIIAGTCLVSMGKKKAGSTSSLLGILFVVLSLTCDGITGGFQKRLKTRSQELGVKAKPYDLMFWTNFYMAITAALFALFFGEAVSGVKFCFENPVIFEKILKFAVCSAVGQSFIFYTISNFDPLVCTTVTTTRKVFSVLLSIFLNGHPLSTQGWVGIGVASAGILAELQDKAMSRRGPPKKNDKA